MQTRHQNLSVIAVWTFRAEFIGSPVRHKSELMFCCDTVHASELPINKPTLLSHWYCSSVLQCQLHSQTMAQTHLIQRHLLSSSWSVNLSCLIVLKVYQQNPARQGLVGQLSQQCSSIQALCLDKCGKSAVSFPLLRNWESSQISSFLSTDWSPCPSVLAMKILSFAASPEQRLHWIFESLICIDH